MNKIKNFVVLIIFVLGIISCTKNETTGEINDPIMQVHINQCEDQHIASLVLIFDDGSSQQISVHFTAEENYSDCIEVFYNEDENP